MDITAFSKELDLFRIALAIKPGPKTWNIRRII